MLKPCEQWNELISAYLDSELDKVELASLQQHLHECDACRTTVELLRCDQQDAAAALLERVAGEQFTNQVMQQIARIENIELEPITNLPKIVEAPPTPEIVLEPMKPKRSFVLRSVKWGVVTGIAAMLVATLFNIMLYVDKYNQYFSRGESSTLNSNANTYSSPPLAEMTPVAMSQQARPPTLSASREPNKLQTHTVSKGQISGFRVLQPKQPTIIPPTLNYGLAGKLLIAYKVQLLLENNDVQQAMESAEVLFHQYDGFVLSSQFQREVGGARATVSGRVPTGKLGTFLIELDKLGMVMTRSVNGDDLTAQHLEQWQKLADLAGYQHNLTTIRDKAGSTDSRVNVEDMRNESVQESNKVTVDEYALNSRVKLAEVSLEIVQRTKVVVHNPYADSASGSWHALHAFGRWLLTLLIPILIWLPVWGPIAMLAYYLYRRRRKPASREEAEDSQEERTA